MNYVPFQAVLLHESSREDGELSITVLDICDALHHASQILCRCFHADDKLVCVVPNLGVRRETMLHRFDVASLDCIEKVGGQCPNGMIFS